MGHGAARREDRQARPRRVAAPLRCESRLRRHRDIKLVAQRLGHTSTRMVDTVYLKLSRTSMPGRRCDGRAVPCVCRAPDGPWTHHRRVQTCDPRGRPKRGSDLWGPGLFGRLPLVSRPRAGYLRDHIAPATRRCSSATACGRPPDRQARGSSYIDGLVSKRPTPRRALVRRGVATVRQAGASTGSCRVVPRIPPMFHPRGMSR